MKLTNKHNLPEPLYQAVLAFEEDYDKSHTKPSDISVTTLIGPVQIDVLKRKHGDELTEDASDRIWAIVGQSIHKILEMGAHRIYHNPVRTEERLYGEVGGWVVSGQYDAYTPSEKLLDDYKMCSIWEHMNGVKPERIAQLNCLAELMRMNDLEVEKLRVIAIYRDWQKSKTGFWKVLQDDKGRFTGEREWIYYNNDYPKHQVAVIPIEMWPQEKALEYMYDRVHVHKLARDGDILPCTDEERWHKPDVYAVMKKTQKRALRLLDSEQEATLWLMETSHKQRNAPLSAMSVVHRPGEDTRCESYCVVSSVCPQFNRRTS